MELIKLNLASKNNKQNGYYLYLPVVFMEGQYWYCESLKVPGPLKLSDVSNNDLHPTRPIDPKYYAANNITPAY